MPFRRCGKYGRTSCGGHLGRERQVCAYGRTCRPFRRPDGSGREKGAGRRCRRRTGGFPNGAVACAERMSLRSRARRIAGIVFVTSRLGKMGRWPGAVRRRSLRFFRRRRFHRRGVANGRRQVFVSVEGGAGCSVRAGRLFTGWLRRRMFCNGLIDNGVNAGSAPALVRDGRGGRTAGNGSGGASDRAGIRLRTDRTFWHFGKIVVTSHVLRGVRRTAILSGCGFPGAKSGGDLYT